MTTQVCRLQFKKAAEAIEGTETVWYKHGVWNPYEKRRTEDVIKRIMKSGYGADVCKDEETGQFYVEIPCDADMW